MPTVRVGDHTVVEHNIYTRFTLLEAKAFLAAAKKGGKPTSVQDGKAFDRAVKRLEKAIEAKIDFDK